MAPCTTRRLYKKRPATDLPLFIVRIQPVHHHLCAPAGDRAERDNRSVMSLQPPQPTLEPARLGRVNQVVDPARNEEVPVRVCLVEQDQDLGRADRNESAVAPELIFDLMREPSLLDAGCGT